MQRGSHSIDSVRDGDNIREGMWQAGDALIFPRKHLSAERKFSL